MESVGRSVDGSFSRVLPPESEPNESENRWHANSENIHEVHIVSAIHSLVRIFHRDNWILMRNSAAPRAENLLRGWLTGWPADSERTSAEMILRPFTHLRRRLGGRTKSSVVSPASGKKFIIQTNVLKLARYCLCIECESYSRSSSETSYRLKPCSFQFLERNFLESDAEH